MITKKSKLFISGHRGFVGSHIYERYKKAGYKNIVVRTRKQLDLTDQRKVNKFFAKEKPEYVILAAAKVGGIYANMTQQAEFLYENLEIQNNVIWSAYLNGTNKLQQMKQSLNTDIYLILDDNYLAFSGFDVYERLSEEEMEEYYSMDYMNKVCSSKSENGIEYPYYWVI